METSRLSVESEPVKWVVRAAQTTQCTIVLKGTTTYVTTAKAGDAVWLHRGGVNRQDYETVSWREASMRRSGPPIFGSKHSSNMKSLESRDPLRALLP